MMIEPHTTLSFEFCDLHLRDYHEEAGTHLEANCQVFKPNHMAMWADNLSQCDSAMTNADNALNQMSAETARLTWEQDTLKLASDIAMIGKMFNTFQKTERTRHLQKVTHLRLQRLD